MLADLHERLRAEGAVERLQDFDVVEAIHAGREERDEQLCSWMHRRESGSADPER